jgi:hypothetical protein
MIVTVKQAEEMDGDYGQFLKVTGVNDKGVQVFRNVSVQFKDKWEALKQPNAVFEFKMMQKNKKWIIEDIIPIGEKIQPIPSEPTPAGVQQAYQEAKKELSHMTKQDWEARDARTRKSIERQKAGDLGMRAVELSGIKEQITEKAIHSAKLWEKFFETGD